ncbi:MAG: hypothetical protein QM811_03310 [Pirellulales bacterium]
MAVVIANVDLGRWNGQADRAGKGGRSRRVDGRNRGGLGQAIAFEDDAAGDRLPLFRDGALAGHSARDRQHQPGKVELLEILVVGERVEQRVEAGEEIDLVFAAVP